MVDDFTAGKVDEIGRSPEEGMLKIEEICEDILTALKGEIRQREIKVSINLMVKEINFPRNSLRSIFYNLINNAVKFSDPIKDSKIKITTEAVDDFIILCVRDNGVGIPREHHGKIFKKSSRLSMDIPGTGMGLYVVKNMIEDNKGRIKLESKQGAGSTFKVFFRTRTDHAN